MKYSLPLLKIAMAGLLFACGTLHAGDTNKGRQLFGSNCAMCHGQTGRSVMAGAPNFDRGEGMMRADSALLGQIRSGKNACPAFRGMLADRDILDVIAYMRTLH